MADWDWLTHYLQLHVDLSEVVRLFPDDEPMRAAVAACRGLRLLRQDPWECLASFILSSTKQIVQIRQIISPALRTLRRTAGRAARLAARFRLPLAQPAWRARPRRNCGRVRWASVPRTCGQRRAGLQAANLL